MTKILSPDEVSFQSPHASQIYSQLHRELTSATEMVDRLKSLRDALVAGGVDLLTDALEEEAAAVKKAEEIRSDRQKLMQDLAERFDINLEECSFGDLIQTVPTEDASPLVELRDQLLQLTEEAQKLNNQNALLLYQSVELTRQILDALTVTGPPAGGYGADGARQASGGHAIVETGG